MEQFKKMQSTIIVPCELKEVMHLAPELASRLVHKTSKLADLDYEIRSRERLQEGMDVNLRKLRAQISMETMNILGAMNAVFKEYYNMPLFKEFIDYKHVTQLTGEQRVKTISQMAACLNIADICCREIWADYLEAEGDEYMKKEA